MPTLYIAANLINPIATSGFGHLQFVYGDYGSLADETTGNLLELEVQSPDRFNPLTGEWTFPGVRNHGGENATEDETTDDSTTSINHLNQVTDPSRYVAASFPLRDGQEVSEVWQLLQNVATAIQTAFVGNSLNYDANQNSNSFVRTILDTLGVSIADISSVFDVANDTFQVGTSFPGFGINILEGQAEVNGIGGGEITPNINLTGTNGNDYISLRGGNDTLAGGEGDDTLYGGEGVDQILGGEGNDLIYFDAEDTLISGGQDASEEDRDIVIFQDGEIPFTGPGGPASEAPDVMIWDSRDASFDAEVIIGGGADDIIYASAEGGELVAGGEGNDNLYIPWASSEDDSMPTIFWGGEGDDIVHFSFAYDHIDNLLEDDGFSITAPNWGEGNIQSMGIMVVNVDNLNEENFGLFDLEDLGLGPDFDWSLIDLVLLNPDQGDRIVQEVSEASTPLDTPTNSEELISGAPIFEYQIGVEEFIGPDGVPWNTPSVGFTDPEAAHYGTSPVVGDYQLEFGGETLTVTAAGATYHFVYEDPDPGNNIGGGGDCEVDEFGDPCSGGSIDPDLTNPANWTQSGLFAFPDGVEFSDELWFSGGDGPIDEAGPGSIEDVPTFTSPDGIGSNLSNWFLVGATFDGFSIVADGTYSVTLDDHELEEELIVDVSDIFDPDAAEEAAALLGTDGADIINAMFVDSNGGQINDTGQTILAGAGDDYIYAGAGDDNIEGGAGRDVIRDGEGDDTVNGGAGRDYFYAGDGADAYEGGGTERDELLYTTSTSGLTIDMTNAANSTGIAAGDTFSNIEFLYGSEFDDVIIMDAQRAFGRGGNDTLQDAAGHQTFNGGSGNDTFAFVAGDGHQDRVEDFTIGEDILDLSAWGVTSLNDVGFDIYERVNGQGQLQGDLIVEFNGESIQLQGLTQADIAGLDASHFVFGDPVDPPDPNPFAGATIDGTGGDDRIDAAFVDVDGESISGGGQIILAGAGSDLIYDGAGDDTVDGGAGRDYFYAGDGADAYEGGGTERDEVFYTTSTSGLTIDMTDASNSTGIAAGDTFSNIEFLYGSEFDDVIIMDTQRAFGRGGNDVLQDGAGFQVFNGGSGNDTFVFIAGDGHRDRVEDFTIGEDMLDLSAWGVTSLNDAGFNIYERVNGQGQLQGDLIVEFNGESVQLQGLTQIDIAGIDASHFLFAQAASASAGDEYNGFW